MTKEGSKKDRRVYTRNTEGTGAAKKTEKGKGKEKNERKQKRGEDGEMELEQSWREFVMAKMMRMDELLEGLTREKWIYGKR